MYQASQKAVVQEANMTLINIRSAEIDYFTTFFGSFGLQASIVSGAICGSLSQTPALHGYDCPYTFVFYYFVTAATSLAISLYAILSGLFLIVYGNGYALRGPLGSMVQTIDGMIFEQHSIVAAFCFSLLFFQLSMSGMFMVVMDDTCGPISFAIVLIGIFITWRHCLRIFNRFRFVNPLARWNDDDDDPMKQFEEDNPGEKLNTEAAAAASSTPHSGKTGKSSTKSNKSSAGGRSVAGDSRSGHSPRTPGSSSNKSFLSRFLSPATSADHANQYAGSSSSSTSPKRDPTYVDQEDSESPYVQLAEQPTTYRHHLALTATSNMEGYLTIKSHKMVSMLDPWSRKYFVLRGKQIFIYATRAAFTERPEAPINMRPIDLTGYSLIAGSPDPPYAISLVPTDAEDIREAWKFRCDTLSEYQTWLERFTKALKMCTAEDLVVIKGGVRGKAKAGSVISNVHEQL